jgi:hypothetical protein
LRNPLAVIEPSGYATAAATAKRNGVSSPISLLAGKWAGSHMVIPENLFARPRERVA